MHAAEGMYNYKVVRQFAVASVVWGVVGMLVGVMPAHREFLGEQRSHILAAYVYGLSQRSGAELVKVKTAR